MAESANLTFLGAGRIILGMDGRIDNRNNPFTPGAGSVPPYFAGRQQELSVSDECLARLIPSKSKLPTRGVRRPLRGSDGVYAANAPRMPLGPMVIYGPRGNGKTALLREIRRQAKAMRIQSIRVTPDELAHPQAFALRLRRQAQVRDGAVVETATHVEGEVKVGPAAISGGKSTRRVMSVDTLTDALLFIGGAPVLITIDEAHRLPLKGGELLLQAEQEARTEDAKIQLVFAGTPDLPDHMGRMNATFWDRLESRERRLGLLAPENAEDIEDADWLKTIGQPIRETLQADVDLAIAPRLLELTSGYPYFLQAMGKALWNAAARRDEATAAIGEETLAAAEPAFQKTRAAYYHHRVRDLQAKGCLGAAYAVSHLAELSGGWNGLDDAHILAAAQCGARLGVEAPDAPIPPDVVRALRHEGFLWEDEPDAQVTCGIPTLSGHVIDHIRRRRSSAAKALESDPEFAELLSGA